MIVKNQLLWLGNELENVECKPLQSSKKHAIKFIVSILKMDNGH